MTWLYIPPTAFESSDSARAQAVSSWGIDLGSTTGATGVCYVEREIYPASILVAAMERGDICAAPIWSDVRTFEGRPWRGVVDCVAAGYPCQPFSFAGKQLGEQDERHVWPDIARIVGEVEPPVCFLENVRGHVRNGLDVVCRDLRRMGFEVRAGLFSAAEVGAPHRRVRLFILAAHPDREPLRFKPERLQLDAAECGYVEPGDAREARALADVDCVQLEIGFGPRFSDREGPSSAARDRGAPDADADGRRLETIGLANERGQRSERWHVADRLCDPQHWASRTHPEPSLHRMDDGLADWMDRLRATGNGVVPQQAARAWRVLWAEMFSLPGQRLIAGEQR